MVKIVVHSEGYRNVLGHMYSPIVGFVAYIIMYMFFVFYFIFLFFIFLRKDTCPPNRWKEEKEVRTGVGKD